MLAEHGGIRPVFPDDGIRHWRSNHGRAGGQKQRHQTIRPTLDGIVKRLKIGRANHRHQHAFQRTPGIAYPSAYRQQPLAVSGLDRAAKNQFTVSAAHMGLKVVTVHACAVAQAWFGLGCQHQCTVARQQQHILNQAIGRQQLGQ